MNETKYGRLVETLRGEILDGKYDADIPLPSMRALIRRFKISDRTVQHALDELEREGLICRRQGSGTFVTSHCNARKIGLIVPGAVYSEFFSLIVCEVLRLAQRENKELQFADISSRSPEVRVRMARKLAKELIEQGVSGILYQPLEFVRNSEDCNREIVSQFAAAGIPVVLIDCDIVRPPHRSDYDLIGIDNESAAGMLAELLISRGARNIHFLMHPDHSPNMYKRINGVRNVLSAHGLGWTHRHVIDCSPEDVRAIARHLRGQKPDAIVCGTDLLAAGLNQTLGKLGVRVPDDIQIVGFDDLHVASVMSPPLTTVHQPCEVLARRAFYRLLERIADSSLETTEMLLAAPLVVRGSTKRKENQK